MTDPKERKEKTIEKLKAKGIDYIDWLPVIESSSEVNLKSLDEICYRAIASLLIIQIACDVNQSNDKFQESKEYFEPLLKLFNVEDKLLPKEKELYDGKFTEQSAVNISWTYESFWSLAWALGLVDDIEDASGICDTSKAISFVSKAKDFNDFKSKCKLRDIEEILDMVDLYFRYNWATTEKRFRNDANTADLNDEVVIERRRGLEWLISPENDWFEISLDT